MSTTVASPREMRQRADWMAPKDDPILEAFLDWGNLTPGAVSREGVTPRADVGPQWASDRCRVLWRRGMLALVDSRLYQLTDEGRAYLNEELDATTLEESEEGPVAER